MILRHQLPAHSPLSARALMTGLAGALGSDGRVSLTHRIQQHWHSGSVAFAASGTDALSLVLDVASADRSRLVALPAYACYDLATAALSAGARIVMYDVNPDTLAPEPESLTRALEHRPGAIVVVHQYGMPVDVPSIAALAARAGTLTIEDSAQAIGTTVGGKPAGSLGSVAILSFGRGKGLTGGSGGAVLASDEIGEEIVARVCARIGQASAGWSSIARAAAQWLLARPGVYRLPAALPFLRLGETVFQPPRAPSAMARSSVNVVNANWSTAFSAVAVRQRNAQRLLTTAARFQTCKPFQVAPQCTAGFLRLPLRAPGRLPTQLGSARRLGIAPGYPMPLFALPGLAAHCVESGPFPGAISLSQSLFTLPTHALLTERDLGELESWLAGPISPNDFSQPHFGRSTANSAR